MSHSGSWAAFATFVLHFPQQKAGVVVLANSPSVNASRAAFQVADLALGAELAAVPSPEGPRPAMQLSAATMDAYAGTYKLGPGWYATIRRNGDALTVQASGEGITPMVPWSERELFVPNYGASMTVERGADGRVTQLMYRGRPAPRMTGQEPAPRPLTDYLGEYTSEELQTTYRVSLRDDTLRINHRRHGTLVLDRRWGEEFGTTLYFLRGVTFTRDGRGRVTGMTVNVDERSREIRFGKVR